MTNKEKVIVLLSKNAERCNDDPHMSFISFCADWICALQDDMYSAGGLEGDYGLTEDYLNKNEIEAKPGTQLTYSKYGKGIGPGGAG